MEFEAENLNIEQIMADRRKAIAASLESLNAREFETLTSGLFADSNHPWRETLQQFVAEHPFETFHHATIEGGVHIFYCSAVDKGMWFLPNRGVGLLQGKGLMIMKEIAVSGS